MLIAGCNNPLDKSVIEPLPLGDLKEIIERDTLFEYTYKAIEDVRNSKLTSDIEKAKWSDMTYKRVDNIFKLIYDNILINKYIDTLEIKSEWENKFGMYIPKLDSISNYWKDYLKENSLFNYLSVEVFDIKKGKYDCSQLGLKVTPLKGMIYDLTIGYYFIPNKYRKEFEEKSKYSKPYIVANDIIRRFSDIEDREYSGYFMYEKPVSNTKVIWDDYVDIMKRIIFADKNLEELLKEYFIVTDIVDFKMKGKEYSRYDIEIPNNIKWM